MHQQRAHGLVAALAAAAQPLLAAGRLLARRQAQPGRKVAPALEGPPSPLAATIAVAVCAPLPGTSSSRRHAARSTSYSPTLRSSSYPASRRSAAKSRLRGDSPFSASSRISGSLSASLSWPCDPTLQPERPQLVDQPLARLGTGLGVLPVVLVALDVLGRHQPRPGLAAEVPAQDDASGGVQADKVDGVLAEVKAEAS